MVRLKRAGGPLLSMVVVVVVDAHNVEQDYGGEEQCHCLMDGVAPS